MPYILTRSGKHFSFKNPDVSMIDIGGYRLRTLADLSLYGTYLSFLQRRATICC